MDAHMLVSLVTPAIGRRGELKLLVPWGGLGVAMPDEPLTAATVTDAGMVRLESSHAWEVIEPDRVYAVSWLAEKSGEDGNYL